jgi:hypothetical protein
LCLLLLVLDPPVLFFDLLFDLGMMNRSRILADKMKILTFSDEEVLLYNILVIFRFSLELEYLG